MQKFQYQIPDPKNLYPAVEDSTRKAPGPLVSFHPESLNPELVLMKEIIEWTDHAGSYGMGGPGFLGFCFGKDWMIVAIWGAASWFRFDGRMLVDRSAEKQGRPEPWITNKAPSDGSPFKGLMIAKIEVQRDSMTATFNDGRLLRISPDAMDRPNHEGSGEARRFDPDDDLRKIVFLSPTASIFI